MRGNEKQLPNRKNLPISKEIDWKTHLKDETYNNNRIANQLIN